MNLLDPLPIEDDLACKYCQQAKEMPYFGCYYFSCVHCCARFVLAMPDAQRIYNAYDIFRGRMHSPSIERIEAEVLRIKSGV